MAAARQKLMKASATLLTTSTFILRRWLESGSCARSKTVDPFVLCTDDLRGDVRRRNQARSGMTVQRLAASWPDGDSSGLARSNAIALEQRQDEDLAIA